MGGTTLMKASFPLENMNGTVCLAFQLIARKMVRKNIPKQVTGFVFDFVEKCVEGIQMNLVKYLVNQLELDFCEAQD
jgi:hypothetical protein